MTLAATKVPAPSTDVISDDDLRETVAPKVKQLLSLEAEAITKVSSAIEGEGWEAFSAAVKMIETSTGRIITTGMGKSGHIGRKVAATMASLGTPAYFVHPGEASHGDLGMVVADDVVIAFSNSGNTAEMHDIIGHARQIGAPVIGITMGPNSFLAAASTVTLLIPKTPEGCPNGLAPTTSTTAQLALGDALAVAVCVRRQFTHDHFRRLHPGGSLGQATTRVSDVMATGDDMPLVAEQDDLSQALITMARRGYDIAGVIGGNGTLVGVVRAADLHAQFAGKASDLMRLAEPVLQPDMSMSEAKKRLSGARVKAAFVVLGGVPVGILRATDND